MSSSDHETALSLVREGWEHYRLQRPLAAWASWRRALGFEPDLPDARQALEGLERSTQLPRTARTPLRFEAPQSTAQRKRWDKHFRGKNMEDLADAAEVFAALAHDYEDDGQAWYNYAVCVAWQGRNEEAVDALDRVLGLWSHDRFDEAVLTWTVAEVLRQGKGAEPLADDLAYAWMLDSSDEDAALVLARLPNLQRVPPPIDPATGTAQFPDAQAFTWLDRPESEQTPDLGTAPGVPRVLAQILRLPGHLRVSSPDAVSLERVFSELMTAFGDRLSPMRRESVPLPIPLLDAAVWTFRIPPGVDPETARTLARGAIEHYFEDHWIHIPRHGLNERSPLEAAKAAKAGDQIALAKLSAVVRFREELGERPWTADLYCGYPFDRLRRRLGMPLVHPATVDDADHSCMSSDELAAIEPGTLEDSLLAEAYHSAAALRNDPLAARFAAELARRNAASLAGLDTPALIATLVRQAMNSDDSNVALDWLDQARGLNRDKDNRTYDIWSAEIYARTGAPGTAVHAYRELLDQDPDNAALALDAAETLIDNGYQPRARPFLLEALARARRVGDNAVCRRAETLLAKSSSGLGNERIGESPGRGDCSG